MSKKYKLVATFAFAAFFTVAGLKVVNAQSAAPVVSSMNPTSAVPGATINVAGSGYDNTTYVSIDNGAWVLDPSVYALGTTLSFVLPSNITAGTHTVQIGNKGSAYSEVTAGSVMVTTQESFMPKISSISPTTAQQGDTITVYGSNLYGDGVVFDGIELSTSMTTYGTSDTSGNSLTFTVPAIASVGSHTIQVEQRIVGGLSNSVTLNVAAMPATPILTSLSVDPTSLTSGQTAAISYAGTNLSTVNLSVTCPFGVSSPDGHGGDACGRTSTFADGYTSTQLEFVNSNQSSQQLEITVSAYNASNSLVGTKSAYVTVAPAAVTTMPVTSMTTSTPTTGSGTGGSSSDVALQQELTQLLTLLLQLLQQAAAKGLLSASQLNAAWGSLSK